MAGQPGLSGRLGHLEDVHPLVEQYREFVSVVGDRHLNLQGVGRHDRLVDVKSEWDPENVFRMGQTIDPRT